jgi:hypothetical protein
MRDGTPKGYAFIDFKGNSYELRYKVADRDPSYQMDIFAPKVIEKDKRTSAGIFVNFFIGNEKSPVRYRIDGGEWQDMRYLEDYDPSICWRCLSGIPPPNYWRENALLIRRRASTSGGRIYPINFQRAGISSKWKPLICLASAIPARASYEIKTAQ